MLAKGVLVGEVLQPEGRKHLRITGCNPKKVRHPAFNVVAGEHVCKRAGDFFDIREVVTVTDAFVEVRRPGAERICKWPRSKWRRWASRGWFHTAGAEPAEPTA